LEHKGSSPDQTAVLIRFVNGATRFVVFADDRTVLLGSAGNYDSELGWEKLPIRCLGAAAFQKSARFRDSAPYWRGITEHGSRFVSSD
jgi:hypothetical protein